MKNCDSYRLKLADFVNRCLSAVEEGEVSAHVASCAECQRELKELGNAFQVLSREKEISLPQGFWNQLSNQIVSEITSKPAQPRFAWRMVLVPVASAAVILLTLFLFRTDQRLTVRQSPDDNQTLSWVEPTPESSEFEKELETSLVSLKEEVDQAYVQNEEITSLVTELSEEQFVQLEEKIKNSKLFKEQI